MKKLMALTISGILTLSMGASVFADTVQPVGNEGILSSIKSSRIMGKDFKDFKDIRTDKSKGLEELLNSGKITQEKYNELLANRGQMNGLRTIFEGFNGEEIRLEMMADITDKTVEELKEMRENKELRAYIKDSGISKDKFEDMNDKINEAREDFIEDKLEDGEITQDQYDKYIASKDKIKASMVKRDENKGVLNGFDAKELGLELFADVTDKSVDELKEMIENKEIREYLKNNMISEEDRSQMLETINVAREEFLKEKLESGEISQEQYENFIKAKGNRSASKVTRINKK